MENKKQKKERRSYLNDIKPGPNGEYIYTGQHISYNEAINTRKSILLKLWLFLIPAIGASISSGLIQTPFMMDTWYTVGFCGLEIVCLASVTWAILRVSFNGENLRDYIKKQTVDQLPLRCWFTFTFACAGLIGSVIYSIINDLSDAFISSCIYMMLKLITAICSFLIQSIVKKISWNIPNN